MGTIRLSLPESLHRQMRELAEQEGILLNQFAVIAIAEKLSALLASDYLEQRARRGNRSKFEAALSQVPAAPPEAHDAL